MAFITLYLWLARTRARTKTQEENVYSVRVSANDQTESWHSTSLTKAKKERSRVLMCVFNFHGAVEVMSRHHEAHKSSEEIPRTSSTKALPDVAV